MEETKQSLIASLPSAPRKPKSKVERVVRKTFKGTAHLSNLLPTGSVRYGLATWSGLLVMDGSISLTEEEREKYKLKILDFIHAIMSMLVFFAVSMFDQNVTRCLFPVPSEETKEILTSLPFVIGVICGAFFLAFPTRRHGIGSPLTKE
ncbi:unnamed protein product [Arabidopsis thaliana]|uniref:(thale cress) hypothetical protein n=1 Tax=Arabidopsis thaliana TaxID=3702 RepID=A0A7G2F852_ARATH|nr:unnamed protein product [Arabidopsis thaliana]